MQQLRAKLVLLEAEAGSNVDVATDALLERTQGRLPADAALLNFHLGEKQSFLWAVSHERFRLYRLPGKSDLTADIMPFAESVRAGSGSATSLGNELYRKLFGQLEASFRNKPQWILALDEQLFHVPFAALVVDTAAGEPVYLAQRHSIRIATGAVMLAESRQPKWREILSGRFLGVGDAIYNTADPRWSHPPAERASFLPGMAYAAGATSQRGGPVLARLAGSAREVESCAQAWDGRSGRARLLEGSEASPGGLRDALRAGPSVVHIAAHFLQATSPPNYSLIALSLRGAGDPQLLSPLEITRSKFNAGVVVLSGCSSGRADALPATGLMGLTRAWLAGGARAVVASHWPTPDDSGSLFVDFYKHLHETPDAGPAVALQGAQRDIVRAGGWRSNPQYWATYFVVGDQ
jgi:CHAT domain-containing protein